MSSPAPDMPTGSPPPSPDAGGAGPGPGAVPPGAGPPQAGAGVQAPGNPTQMLLAQMFQVCQRMQMENPQISGPMAEACRNIQQAQTSLLMGGGPGAPTPAAQNPPV